MSPSEIQPASNIGLAPAAPVRVAFWFTIYLAGSLLFALEMARASGIHTWERTLEAIGVFPLFFGEVFSTLPNSLLSYLPFYGLYFAHLVLTMRVRRAVSFFIMLAFLVLIIGVNFLGVYEMEISFGKSD